LRDWQGSSRGKHGSRVTTGWRKRPAARIL